MSRPQECEDCMAAVAAFGGNTCVNCRKDAARGFFDGAACNAPKTVKAEATARLHEALEFMSFDGTTVRACTADLRALLDAHAALETAHTEALDALEGLDDACAAVASWSSDCIDFNDPVRERARAVLAKAGRR